VLDALRATSGTSGADKIYGIVLVATIVYLLASLFMSTAINGKFLRIAKDNRAVWRSKLYGFLSDEDFSNLAVGPIEKTIRTYRFVLVSGWIVTAIVCLLLAVLAYQSLYSPSLALCPLKP
jgi:hypothetical protein